MGISNKRTLLAEVCFASRKESCKRTGCERSPCVFVRNPDYESDVRQNCDKLPFSLPLDILRRLAPRKCSMPNADCLWSLYPFSVCGVAAQFVI